MYLGGCEETRNRFSRRLTFRRVLSSGRLTCRVDVWGYAEEHGAGVGRESSPNLLQETVAVKVSRGVRDGSHAGLSFHTWRDAAETTEKK